MRYDFEIQYKSKCENKVVNALSCHLKFEEEMKVVLAMQVVRLENIDQEVVEEVRLQNLV